MIQNWHGLRTLLGKEIWRFMKVTVQTVLTPVVTSLLYLLVFAQVLEGQVEVFKGISYLAFLIPGLIIMAMIQNAFANSSSSLIQSKMNGNIVFVLLAPLSPLEFLLAFLLAAIIRGMLVGLVFFLVALFFVDLPLAHVGLIFLFGFLSTGVLGGLGVIAGIWADKFDQLAAFQNFIILPLSFLSGVFYSLYSLPQIWQLISRFNPFFYMIDGFRYGFLGASDVPVGLSLGVTASFFLAVTGLCLVLLHRGYKIRQ